MPGTSATGRSIPYAAWLAQPDYLAGEVLLALVAGVGYSLTDDTISALGTACDADSPTGCSSAPLAMNVVFVVFGALQAVGALPLLRSRPRSGLLPVGADDTKASGRRRTVGWLWLLAGVFSVGVGLAPVDTHPTLHALVALPVFVAQPVALVLHARWLTAGRLRLVGTALGVAAVVGALAFAALLGSETGVGAAERLAIWPAKLWLPLAAATVRKRLPGDGPARPRPGGTRPASPPRG